MTSPASDPGPLRKANSDPERPPVPWALLAMLVVAFSASYWLRQVGGDRAPEIGYSTFYDLAERGQVKSVTMLEQSVEGDLRSKQHVENRDVDHFRTTIPARDDDLVPLLRSKQVHIDVVNPSQSFGGRIIAWLPWIAVLGFWVWVSRRTRRFVEKSTPFGVLKPRSHRFEKTAHVETTFGDVAGLKEAKRDLQEVVGFLKEPERFQRLGGKVPRGVLLVGSPGTGKTLLARAVAGESGVPFFSITASEFIELFVGVGAARVRELFQEAKQAAPAILFIDEIDAVGRSRGTGLGGGHDEREQTLNQLLSEMDGFARTDRVVVLAATNRPDVLDPALQRPGRFDRRVVLDRPELEARRAILEVHVRKKPLGKDVDLEAIARNTVGFSGADLANLVNEAALSATRRGGDWIEASDFSDAQDKIMLGNPREAKLNAEERRRVAVHESGHAVLAYFLEQVEPVQRVSILPRGMALGVTRQAPGHDRHLMTRAELDAKLCVLMGGRAAERLLLGDVSTGVESDLKEASLLATRMVAHYGMSQKLGPVYYERDMENPFLGRQIATEGGSSDATSAAIETEARLLLGGAFERATQVLEKYDVELRSLVTALLERETIERPELEVLLGSSPARPASDQAEVFGLTH